MYRAIEVGDCDEAHAQMTRMMATAASDAEAALAQDPRALAAIRKRNREGTQRRDEEKVAPDTLSII